MHACWRTYATWCSDPHRLLREADRVLIDDGWLVLIGFNPLSLMGLRKLVPVLRRAPPYNSRMFTLMRQLDWLSLLNFEVLAIAVSGCALGA
jgi:SAM-dependent methyltransferase